MKKFTIAMIILVVGIIGIFFVLEVPYENNYAAQMGDTATVSYTVTDAQGNDIASEAAEKTVIVIGSDTKPQEFEAQIVGMKRGDTKEFTITYPSDYSIPSLQGQTRIYTLSVLDIEKCTGSLDTCGALAEYNRQNPGEEITEEPAQ